MEHERMIASANRSTSSTLIYRRIARSKFNGSRRCIILTAVVIIIVLLSVIVASVAAAFDNIRVILREVQNVGDCVSLIIALVVVFRAELAALSQRNTYGFARAEVVATVIVCTFLAGDTLESILELIDHVVQFHGRPHFQSTQQMFWLDVGSSAAAVFLRVLLIIVCLSAPLRELRTRKKKREDEEEEDEIEEEVISWRWINPDLLLKGFVLVLVHGAIFNLFDISLSFIYRETALSVGDGGGGRRNESGHKIERRAADAAALQDPPDWVVILDEAKDSIGYILVLPCVALLMKRSCLIVLQTVPPQYDVSELKDKLLKKVPGLTSVHEFHLWQLDANRIVVTSHVKCPLKPTLEEYESLRREIRDFFHEEGIHSLTIQPEFTADEDRCQQKCKDEWEGPPCEEYHCCSNEVSSSQAAAAPAAAASPAAAAAATELGGSNSSKRTSTDSSEEKPASGTVDGIVREDKDDDDKNDDNDEGNKRLVQKLKEEEK